MTREEAAWRLLEELRSARLEVARLGNLRVAITTNAEWYQRFCNSYKRSRKRYPRLRTFIKRQTTIQALERIAFGRAKGTPYEERLEPFLDQALSN
jgi:hypothetical protein